MDSELPSVDGWGGEMVAENFILMQIYAGFFIKSREKQQTSIEKTSRFVFRNGFGATIGGGWRW